MYNRDKIYAKFGEALQQGTYNVPNGRPRILSLLSGALLGVSQTLPSENIAHCVDRFKFDLVEPTIARFSEYVANRHISSTPTLRSMTIGAVDLRLAIAHNPVTLKSPVETLQWLVNRNDVTLFKDNVLNVFRKLNISPFDIEIKHLFKAFVETDANLYQTTMNGIQAYFRRSYTRVNGTQIPLPSITEEELAIIASGYLGILVAYVLPLPITPVDNLQMYWTTNILPQVFKLVDQFNERNIIDTKHIESVAKSLYFARYNVIHVPDDVAHTLVYLLLTGSTTNLPPLLLENMNDELRDQLADDTRDILVASRDVEKDHFEDMCVAYTPGYVDLGEIDQQIAENIENDMDTLYMLQDMYVHSALNESNVLTLENLHARYYHLVKPIHHLSLESMQSDKYKGTTVSTEGIPLIIFGALVVAIGAAIALAIKAILGIFGIGNKAKAEFNLVQETDKYIKHTMTQIVTHARQVDDVGVKIGNWMENALKRIETEIDRHNTEGYSNVRKVISTIRRYNPGASLPKSDDIFTEGSLYIIKELKNPEKILANIFTRSDNKHVPQVSKLFETREGVDQINKSARALFDDTFKAIEGLSQISDDKISSRIVTELSKNGESATLTAFIKQTTELESSTGTNTDRMTDLLVDQVAVNQVSIYTLVVEHPEYIADIFSNAADKGKQYQKYLTNAKSELQRSLQKIEEAVKSGKLDDKYGKQISDAFNKRVSVTRKIIINSARTLNALVKQEFTILQFINQYKHLVTNISHAFAFLNRALEAAKTEDE